MEYSDIYSSSQQEPEQAPVTEPEYNSFAETIGEMVGGFFVTVFSFIFGAFADLFRLIGTGIKYVVNYLRDTIGYSIRDFFDELSDYRYERKEAKRAIRQEFRQHPTKIFSIMNSYRKALSDAHPGLVPNIVNTILPLAGLAVLICSVADRNLGAVRGEDMVIVAVVDKAGIDFINRAAVQIIPENAAVAVVDQGFSVRRPVRRFDERVKKVDGFALSGDGVIDFKEGLVVIPVPDAVLVNHGEHHPV